MLAYSASEMVCDYRGGLLADAVIFSPRKSVLGPGDHEVFNSSYVCDPSSHSDNTNGFSLACDAPSAPKVTTSATLINTSTYIGL